MIVLRMILGGVLGLIAGLIVAGLTGAGIVSAGGDKEMVVAIAPFGGLLGMGIGATSQLLRSDKKR